MHRTPDLSHDAAAQALFRALLWLALLPVLLAAQEPRETPEASSPGALADSLEDAVTEAALRGETGRLAELVRVAGRARDARPEDPWMRHYLGYALYRLGSAEMAEDPRSADGTLARALEVLEASAREDSIPESFALAALAAGMRIAAAPRRHAAALGPRVGEYLRAAVALAPDNPRVWLLRGVNAVHAPRRHGGGRDRARRHLEKALSLFDGRRSRPPAPGWGRAEAHAWLGRVHARAGEPQEAREEYRRALEIAPGYTWVEEELLTALE